MTQDRARTAISVPGHTPSRRPPKGLSESPNPAEQLSSGAVCRWAARASVRSAFVLSRGAFPHEARRATSSKAARVTAISATCAWRRRLSDRSARSAWQDVNGLSGLSGCEVRGRTAGRCRSAPCGSRMARHRSGPAGSRCRPLAPFLHRCQAHAEALRSALTGSHSEFRRSVGPRWRGPRGLLRAQQRVQALAGESCRSSVN
jgi:hypothetical protein